MFSQDDTTSPERDRSPDAFLSMIRRARRGRLKIYLGYAAGVGKTYQMLTEAGRLREDGLDVVAGYVETHGRAETAALLEGIEVVPRTRMMYRGIEIEEMDLDAVLSRRPAVVLVDELAHTNVPGSRNAKRYQDVEEILAQGIHVISTLNVQHLESLYETVERATGTRVKERVPDRIVAEADQIVNIDITPEDLRRRLREGRIYTPERIETALDHFFRPANLEQLRELTLRELAAQIDARRRDPQAGEAASSPDQVMVCLSSRGPNSGALLRYASRLAGRLNRNWYAVYVQTASEHPNVIDAETQRILSNTLTLAQQLGATVFTYKGDDIVDTLLQFAREYRVGHIVIGAPGRRVPFLRRLMGETSIVERLTMEGRGITVVVLDTMTLNETPVEAAKAEAPSRIEEPMGDAAARSRYGESLAPLSHLLVWQEVMEKNAAIRGLLELSCADRPDLIENAWLALLERERQGGTFLGEEVVLPHARIAGLNGPVVALGVNRLGVYDPDVQRSARIMLLLLSPADKPELHVRALGAIGRLVQDDVWRKRVLAVTSTEELSRVVGAIP